MQHQGCLAASSSLSPPRTRPRSAAPNSSPPSPHPGTNPALQTPSQPACSTSSVRRPAVGGLVGPDRQVATLVRSTKWCQHMATHLEKASRHTHRCSRPQDQSPSPSSLHCQANIRAFSSVPRPGSPWQQQHPRLAESGQRARSTYFQTSLLTSATLLMSSFDNVSAESMSPGLRQGHLRDTDIRGEILAHQVDGSSFLALSHHEE